MIRSLTLAFTVTSVWFAGAQTISFAPAALYDAGYCPFGLHVADMNGDGYLDIVVSDGVAAPLGLGQVVMLFNKGDGTFGTPIGNGPTTGAILAVGDLDGDGDQDVAAFSLRSTDWYENDGQGNLVQRALPDANVTGHFGIVGAALLDIDDNGTLDIGLLTGAATFELSSNFGGGVFGGFQSRKLFDVGVFDWPTAIDAVDLDGDGHQEFVVSSHSPRSFIRLDWNGHRLNPVVLHDVGRIQKVAWGELDGHPGTDALFTHRAANPGSPGRGVWIDCNDGIGGLTNCQQLRQTLDVGSAEAVAVGDLDQDGSTRLSSRMEHFRKRLSSAPETTMGTGSPLRGSAA